MEAKRTCRPTRGNRLPSFLSRPTQGAPSPRDPCPSCGLPTPTPPTSPPSFEDCWGTVEGCFAAVTSSGTGVLLAGDWAQQDGGIRDVLDCYKHACLGVCFPSLATSRKGLQSKLGMQWGQGGFAPTSVLIQIPPPGGYSEN